MNKLIQALVTTVALVYVSASTASTVTIPNTFSSGATTSASDMNANFTAVKAAVDDNNTRITALEGGGSSAPVFQGFSAAANVGSGIRGMHAACHAAFSGSKICNSVEFSNSTYKAVTLSTGPAWLLPVLQQTSGAAGTATGRNAIANVTDQGSGLTAYTTNAAEVFTCKAYDPDAGRSSWTGLTVSNTGSFATSDCDIARPVACCK